MLAGTLKCSYGISYSHSLSIRRFWGKGGKMEAKRERAEGEKRLTQMLLLEPSIPTQHDSNHPIKITSGHWVVSFFIFSPSPLPHLKFPLP